MLKWNLFLTTLPYVFGVVIVKEVLVHVVGFNGLIEFREVVMVLTGGIFLIGFMLAGTMSDYKESEKIPGELASALESAEDTMVQGIINAKDPSKIDLNEYRKSLYEVAKAIYDWLYKRIEQRKMYDTLNEFAIKMANLESLGVSGSAVGKVLGGDVNSIRKITTRLGVISRTDFLATGYALLEVLIACIICVLMTVHFQNTLSEVVITIFVCLIYFYMYRLICDVDDPFEYEDGQEAGVTEVPLFPVEEYMERLQSRIKD
ncbi:MAG: hypothetical protein KDK36_00040 [Leptospiraceae bacterium]|nr:hypothetical protein [Leptospiraceae bacterium]